MKLVQQTWEWLASRVAARTIWNDDQPAGNRLALPAAELLGDRILLDGVQTSAEDQIKGESDAAILIGMIKGEVDLMKVQLDTLGIASKLDVKIDLRNEIVKKLSGEWLDVNDVLMKWGEALIKGELGEKKIAEFVNKFGGELNDVTKLAAKFDTANGLLLPAVQKVNALAGDIFAKLGDIKLGDVKLDLNWQDEHTLIGVGDAFAKMDDIVLNFAVDALTGGIINGASKAQTKIDFFSSKASDYLLKLDDPALQGLLLPAVQRLSGEIRSIIGVLVQPPGGGDGGFVGGVTVESSDDLISEA